MAVTELDLVQRRANPQAERLVSFLCPLCERRLNVPSHLAGVAGPCPACQKMIRAPQVPLVVPAVQSAFPPADEDTIESQTEAEPPVQTRQPTVPFYATKRILPTPADGLDDSWREKVERRRERSRKRRRRMRFLNGFAARAAAPRKIGICVLLGILALTIGFLYLNHQSGGRLMNSGSGY